jgi:FSR family fosmidomycin resistance protein-like MFS transporter
VQSRSNEQRADFVLSSPAELLAAPNAKPLIPNRRGLVLLASSHVIDDLYQGAVPAILPFLVVERAYSYAAAAGITLAATMFSSVAQPAFGWLADRRALPWLTPLSLLIAGTGIALVGLGQSYWWVWAVVALSGLGVAAYHPSAARAARAAAGASAQGMSWFAVGGNIGIALGPVLVTPLMLEYGLQGTPLLLIPAMLMAQALVIVQVRSRRGDERSGREAASTGTKHVKGDDDWRSFAWLTGLVIVRSVAYFGIATMLALYVISRFQTNEAMGTTVLTIFLAVGALATVPGGWLADRWGRLATIRVGYTLLLPAMIVLLLAPTVWVAIVAAVLLGISVYLPFSVQTTLGQDYLPNRIGTASGVTLGLAIATGGAFAPGFGVIADHFGLRIALAGLLMLTPVALLITTQLRERKDIL